MSEVDISQELYDLSGWVDTTYFKDGKHCFDYTLGFLLWKLPVYVPKLHDLNKDQVRHLILHPSDNGRWTVYYTHTTLLIESDTPEEAACRLAIELIKQNIITPEQKGGK